MTIASGTCGESATWRLEDDGTLYIEGTGEMEDYTSSTGQPWYSYLSQITSVVIAEGITHIGQGAFYQHTAITSLSLPSTVTSIGNTANNYGSFAGCTGLVMELLDLSNVTSIGNNAFNNCDSIKSVKLGDIQSWGDYVFTGSAGITSIDFGNVTSLGSDCFNGCTGLSEISFPDSLLSIGLSSFYNCTNLVSVDLNNVQDISSSAFYGCTKLKNIDLSKVKTIGSSAFRNVTPSGGIYLWEIETIGNYAFEDSYSTPVTFGPNLKSIGDRAFKRKYYNSSIERTERTFRFYGPQPTFGEYAVGYYYLNSNKTYNTDNCVAYTTGYSTTVSGKFYAKSFYAVGIGANLSYVVDGDTLTISGSGEMYTLTSSCKLPPDIASCTKIYVESDVVFNKSYISNFKSILTLLSAPCVTTIDDSMFSSFLKLEYVDISGAESIGGSAFQNCVINILNISSAITIGASAFHGNPLNKIILPDTLTSIGASAFKGHRSHGIIVPASVTSIGADAFTPGTNAYRKHMTIVFRGKRISGTYTAPTGMMIHEFCKNEAENDNNADYAAGTVNSSHPVMIRTAGGWRIISTDMIDNT